MSSTAATNQQTTLAKDLSLLDAVLVMVGGVIGSGIFLTAGQIATQLPNGKHFVLVWIAGGTISLLACFAVAELGGMFPQAGGQYVFLREAYGDLPAFLYGWMIFAVVQTGVIAALAVGFAQYFAVLVPAASTTKQLFAVSVPFFSKTLSIIITPAKLVALAAIVALTVVNILGVRLGALFTNAATWFKFAAIAGLIVLGIAFGRGDWSHFASLPASPSAAQLSSAFGVALISVLFAFDGWIYVTWIAGEMKNAARDVPRALIIGIFAVSAVYVALNVIYVYALPMNVIGVSNAVVQDAAAALFSARVAFWFALVVALSCFGAASSAIMCTARIFFAMSEDGLFFKRMAEVHPRFRTPAFSLAVQGAWSCVLAILGLYDQLLTYAIFMMIVSYVATVGALFILRRKLPDHPRPYICTGYPILPALYLVISIAWTLNTIWERPMESLGGLGLSLLGIPGFIYWKRVAVRTS